MSDPNPAAAKSAKDLFPLVYEEVRALAAWYLNNERTGHTLQPTALANEVFLKIAGTDRGEFADKSHFMAAAARAVRQVLCDHARGRGREKRGGGEKPVPLEAAEFAAKGRGVDLADLQALDEAMQELEKLKPRAAQVVELKFFGGLTIAEIAKHLDIADSTVSADWDTARAWLKSRMG